MTAPDPHGDLPHDDDLHAAELAFGLLDPAERRVAEARRAGDVAFAARCVTWRDRAAALLDGEAITPDPAMWERIVARLPANDRGRAETLRRSLRRWRSATAALAVVALGLGMGLAGERRRPLVVMPAPVATPTPILVILRARDRDAIVSVSVDPASGRVATVSDALRVGGHSAQLWVIPAGGTPRSLGLVPAGRQGIVHAARAGAGGIVAGATLAVSLEPVGGSPTGQPTGPVILSGTVA